MNESYLNDLIENFEADEKEIVKLVLGRMAQGQKNYGPWRIESDKRNYTQETLAEIIDAMHYCAAELIRMKKKKAGRQSRGRVIYVCHPYGGHPRKNKLSVAKISRGLLDNGLLPIAPQLFFPQLYSERTERYRALRKCLDYLLLCDEVRVYGDEITEGMEREIMFAKMFGIPVCYQSEIVA